MQLYAPDQRKLLIEGVKPRQGRQPGAGTTTRLAGHDVMRKAPFGMHVFSQKPVVTGQFQS